jgi:hypothetical protein
MAVINGYGDACYKGYLWNCHGGQAGGARLLAGVKKSLVTTAKAGRV